MKKVMMSFFNLVITITTLYVICAYLTSCSENEKTIIGIQRSGDNVIFGLSDGCNYSLDLNAEAYNRNNLLLFYEGKKVW
jgi:hypothetical protein